MTPTPTDTPPEAAALDLEQLAEIEAARLWSEHDDPDDVRRHSFVNGAVWAAARQHAEPEEQLSRRFPRNIKCDPECDDGANAHCICSAKPGATSPSAGGVKELVELLARSRKPWGYAITNIADTDRLVNSLLTTPAAGGEDETA